MITATPEEYAEIRELLLRQDPHEYQTVKFGIVVTAWKQWWENSEEYHAADLIKVLRNSPYLRRS